MIEDCIITHQHSENSSSAYCIGRPHFCMIHGTTFTAPNPCPKGRWAQQMTEKEAQDILLGKSRDEIILDKVKQALKHNAQIHTYRGKVELTVGWQQTALVIFMKDEWS